MGDSPTVFNDRNVYIVGAGFSREAGLPLIADFTMKMRDALEWFQPRAQNSEAEAIRSVLDFRRGVASAAERVPLDLENIEEIFSLAAATGDASLNRNITSAIAATLDFARTSASIPEGRLFLDISGSPARPPRPWKQSGEMRRGAGRTDRIFTGPKYDIYALAMAGFPNERSNNRRDAIISFNYDTLIEEGLGRWRIPFSYRFEKELPSFHTFAQCIQVSSSTRPDAISVLKLHGSVNWALDAENKRLSVFRTYEEVRNKNLSPLLVPPTWRKDPAAQLSDVWDGAVSALRSATNVIIIGYSIPPTDQHFKYLLAAGLRDNISLRKVYFVNPRASELKKRIRTVLRKGLSVVEPVPWNTEYALLSGDFLTRINRLPDGGWALW
jgi:hypothetical protein